MMPLTMPSLTLNRYRFTPKLLPTFVTIIGLIILCKLGFWQLQRAQQKRVLMAQFAERSTINPTALTNLTALKQTVNYLPVKADGYYDNQHQFLLDNKVYKHQVGYEVITPFITANKQVLLVNRGWIKGNVDRRILPPLKPVTGPQQIVGQIKTPVNTFVLSHEATMSKTWPRVIQTIDLPKMAAQLAKPVYPFVLRLNANQAHGFVRAWQPTVMKPEKHMAYAVQWFALAVALLLFYIFINVERKDGNNQ